MEILQDKILPHSSDVEKAVIGALLIESDAYSRVCDILTPESFYERKNQVIYESIRALNNEGKPADMLSVVQHLISVEKLATAGGAEYVASVGSSTLSSVYLEHHSHILVELQTRRNLITFGNSLESKAFDESTDVQSLVARSSDTLADIISGNSQKVFTLTNTLVDIGTIMKRNAEEPDVTRATPTGFDFLDRKGGLQEGDLIIIAGETSMGKALRMDEPILTPKGWVLNKDLKVGDEVASIDGEPSFVQGIYPQGIKEMYRITFSDGRSSVCSGDHLWEVGSSAFKSGNRVLTTTQIKEMQENTCAFHNRMHVPMFCGKFGEHKDFVIHPYILGVLIGDGCLTRGVTVANEDEFVFEKVKSLSSIPVKKRKTDTKKCDVFCITYGHDGNKNKNIYRKELSRLGLLNKLSCDKFIPQEYLESDYDQRLELLNGLMDTDGEVSKDHTICYSTVSGRLANDVTYLCRSLGYKCSVCKHRSAIGEKDYGSHYRLTIAGENEDKIVTLPRRRERIVNRNRIANCIRSVEYVGREECQCIKVSHPRELFVISDFVVTHNTSFANSITLSAIQHQHRVAFYSLEMTRQQLTARLLSRGSKVGSNRILNNGLDLDETRRVNEQRAELLKWGNNLYFDDCSTSNIDKILASIRAMKLRYDIHGAVIDYIQILNVNMRTMNKEQAMADVARRLKNLAKDLKIWVIALSQLNRDRQNPEPSIDRIRDSGQIAEAADVVMLVYRPEYYGKRYSKPFDTVDTRGTAQIDICKGRNIGVGKFICGFDAYTTFFYQLNEIPKYIAPPKSKNDKTEEAPF